MNTRLLLTLIVAFLALGSWADGTEIDGIYYDLNSETKTASVTYTSQYYNYGNSYSGSITIPAKVSYGGTSYSVTSIGIYAFNDCDGLTSVTIPNSVKSIGYGAFRRCFALTSITIPNSVTSIGNNVFAYCASLTSINIPNSVTSIGSYMFSACSGLKSVTIPTSVTSIGEGVFWKCTGLKSINIPNSVMSIGDDVFRDCTGLTSVTIPNSVTSIGKHVFRGCTSLASITVDVENSVYDSRENCNAIIETSSNTIIAGCMNSTIPNSVTSIGNNAFTDCASLTSINIPNSVTSIGEYAFENCTGLTSVTIPNSVTSIGNNAFAYCASLTSINIPNSVTSIETGAFYNCTGLKNVYALRKDAAEYNCSVDYTFNNVPTNEATLHVPSGCRDSYANLAPWSAFGTITDDIDTAIAPIEFNDNNAKYYNIKGQQFINAQPGVNIIRSSDGTTKKVLVK